MSNSVVMGERDRITLPPETLACMNWKAGQRLRLRVIDNGMVIEAFPRKAKPIT